jgi:FKBP-type peptidyl-prolyl cis-trans isomerase FkpA
MKHDTRISKAAFSKLDRLKKPLAALFLCALVLGACNGGGNAGSGSAFKANFGKDESYALGMDVGLSLKENEMLPDVGEFVLGFKDAVSGGKTRFTPEEAAMYLSNAFNSMATQGNEENRQAEIDFLTANMKKEGVVTTPSGLQYEVLVEGKGAKPEANDTVRVNYEGTFINNTIFDSSYSRGEPAEFPLDRVIRGWTEGIQLMGVGSTYRFYIPSALAYGPEGAPMIPPYSALIFKVELLSIVR